MSSKCQQEEAICALNSAVPVPQDYSEVCALKQLAFTSLAKKVIFLKWIVVILITICLLHYYFHLPVTFTPKLQIIMRIDWGKTQQTTPFLVEFVFLELYNTSSKGHSTGRRQNVLQSICISFVTCTQNWDWELLAFYPWRQRHFHDIKRKREKKAHIAVKQELDMVSKCVTL